MRSSRIALPGLFAVLAFGLTGCGDSGVQEVKQWMEDVRRQTRVSVPKLTEPKKFTPFTYGGKDEVDPFSPAKLAAALAKLQGSCSKPIRWTASRWSAR
jgi:type IV pilus assembly protein PilP